MGLAIGGHSQHPIVGIKIVLTALEATICQIVENAGVEGSIVAGKITDHSGATHG